MIAILLLALAQGTTIDPAKILEKADALLQEAKTGYETGREKSSVEAFVDAGFKLEEARIKYMVLQEIGGPELQKTAAERLRSVNQLGKLMHDGRVAISGAPAPKTPDAPEPAKPEPKAPEPPPVDVTRRAPLPDAGKLKDTEKLVRELYKDDYAKKSAADRKAFARLLLREAAKNVGDAPAFWVLCREAQDMAAQVGDVATLVEAVDLAARYLDVDVLALKVAGLTAAGRVAKTPEESTAVAEASLQMLDDLIAADQYDPAEKLATAAQPLAKQSKSVPLALRAANRLKEVSEAKLLYQGMKGVLETLAKTPDQPQANLEMGQYLCYGKGSWELGLRFLGRGADATLKDLAQKELAQPAGSAERVALGDMWFALAEKEKSPLRKSRMQAHAKLLYESAAADASGLLKMKIEKQLGTLDAAPASGGGAVDLLKLIDPSQDFLKGSWTPASPSGFTTQKGQQTLVQIPYMVPDEYDVKMTVIPQKGAEVYIGLVLEKVQFDASVDGWAGTITGFGSIDGKMANENPTGKRGQALKPDAPNAIVCSVRRSAVTLTVNGASLCTFKPEPARLSMNQFWRRAETGLLAVGGWVPFTITKLELVPITGKGRALR